MGKLFAFFGGVVLAVIIIFVMTIVGGFIVRDLWEWFVVPVFPLQQLELGQAIGISFITGYLCKNHNTYKSEEEKAEKWTTIGSNIVYPFLVWFMGWIISIFVI